MLRRAFLLLLAAPLAACVTEPYASGGFGSIPGTPYSLGMPGSPAPLPLAPTSAHGRVIAALLPLTGANAALGQGMLQAAQLALAAPGSPPLDAEDTAGTPDGAANAARAALAKGAGIIIGPLTAPETASVAPLAQAAAVPVLAFTSVSSEARPGIWTLGITPAQQVRALVRAVQGEGKSRLAAVLPQNAFGDALADGLAAATGAMGLPSPAVQRFAPGSFGDLNQALKDVSDYAGRRGVIEARQRAARASNTAAGNREAARIGRETPPPPPFDALFLGAVGSQLGEAVPLLTYYDIAPNETRVLGPALWAREAAHLPGLAGAWYAAPDPTARQGFVAAYSAKYGTPPPALSSLAYDSAAIARAAMGPDGISMSLLQRPDGFAGTDGLLALRPDGQVDRALAIFEVQPGGAKIVQPAAQSLAGPGM